MHVDVQVCDVTGCVLYTVVLLYGAVWACIVLLSTCGVSWLLSIMVGCAVICWGWGVICADWHDRDCM